MTNSGTFGALGDLIAIGGPVLVILILVSFIALTIIVLKVLQFRKQGVGKHQSIRRAIGLWDAGKRNELHLLLGKETNHLSGLMTLAMRLEGKDKARARLETEAEQEFLKLESGMRFLDIVVQLAPLLGLFGTVLGMIEAFQALQGAGSQVDPSVLAGGIWVALVTTAAGLAVAMPVSMALTWLESRIDADRAMADRIISAIGTPIPDQEQLIVTVPAGAQTSLGAAAKPAVANADISVRKAG